MFCSHFNSLPNALSGLAPCCTICTTVGPDLLLKVLSIPVHLFQIKRLFSSWLTSWLFRSDLSCNDCSWKLVSVADLTVTPIEPKRTLVEANMRPHHLVEFSSWGYCPVPGAGIAQRGASKLFPTKTSAPVCCRSTLAKGIWKIRKECNLVKYIINNDMWLSEHSYS